MELIPNAPEKSGIECLRTENGQLTLFTFGADERRLDESISQQCAFPHSSVVGFGLTINGVLYLGWKTN